MVRNFKRLSALQCFICATPQKSKFSSNENRSIFLFLSTREHAFLYCFSFLVFRGTSHMTVREHSRFPIEEPPSTWQTSLFTVYKFRSMAGDAEERLRRDGLWEAYVANGFKLPPGDDPRITGFGAMLRRTSLDELPQLFNALNGTMSLVGPRPVVPEELACYGELTSVYTGVRPGVTGYWQVNGRSDVGFPERAELDAYYYDNRSLRVDLRILVRTIVAVVLRVGAH